MYSVEIQTPISMNENFSVMCYLQVKSIAENAELPGDWKVVYTVSRDSVMTPESPQFRWAKHYPVEFQMVDQDVWEKMHYEGTGLQCITNRHEADVVLFMDADMIVIGPISDILKEVSEDNAIFAWPAWFSGDLPFDELFKAAGIESDRKYKITLTDDGADYNDPAWPPYFNFGFVAVSRDLANDMGKTFPYDQMFVVDHFRNYFSGQVALALNIKRNNYKYRVIDERYNVGSDHPVALAHYEKKLGRRMLPSAIANDDPRVMHYCFPTPTLQKKRDMGNWAALQGFVAREGLEGSEKVIQQALIDLQLFDEDDAYNRIYTSMELQRLRHELAEVGVSKKSFEELKRQLEEKDGALQSAAEKLASLESKLEQDRAEAGARIKALESAQANAEARVKNLKKAQKEAEDRIQDFLNSSSWRLTAPLRRLRAMLARK